MYNYDFDADTLLWLDAVASKLADKMRYAVKKAREKDFIPYSTENDDWKPTSISWWTNGFWPAVCWQMYLATQDNLFRDEAIRTEKMLDEAFTHYRQLSHDNGFMWLIHSGVRFSLEHNADSFDRTLFAAKMLACRYNPHGFIRAWQGQGREGWAIVDCMMNLPMLYWASHMTGDPRYKLMAINHADTTMRTFIRPDGSSNHIVVFDPENGMVLDHPAGQGYAPGSCWSRGLSWAIYGFLLSYLATRKQEYLDVAKRTANHFIANLADDPVPLCDFRQPNDPRIYDTCAGAIAASGMLELGKILPEGEREPYIKAALRILRAIDERYTRWDNGTPALLTHCTAAWHDIPSRHMTMIYADYFFIEAIFKLRGEERLFWLPHFFDETRGLECIASSDAQSPNVTHKRRFEIPKN